MSAEQQVLLLFRVLSYDAAQAARKPLRIAVLYVPQKPSSRGAANEISRALEQVGQRHPALRGTQVGLLAYRKMEELEPVLIRNSINLVYLSTGFGPETRAISNLCNRRSIPSVAGVAGYVTAGVAVGVVQSNGRPRIVVNLPASRTQGMRLHGSLLRLATVVR